MRSYNLYFFIFSLLPNLPIFLPPWTLSNPWSFSPLIVIEWVYVYTYILKTLLKQIVFLNVTFYKLFVYSKNSLLNVYVIFFPNPNTFLHFNGGVLWCTNTFQFYEVTFITCKSFLLRKSFPMSVSSCTAHAFCSLRFTRT